MDFDRRIWAASVFTSLLAYIFVSFAMSGELNLISMTVFVVSFAIGWVLIKWGADKLLEDDS